MGLCFMLVFFPIIALLHPSAAQSNLNPDYYKTSCPQFSKVIQDIVTTKHKANPTSAAATLRLFFIDCMVEGCDASLLIASNSFSKSERDADADISLPGGGFEVVTRAKTALELQCPGIVSCADILVVAARDVVTAVGGPHYDIGLGRKDSLESKPAGFIDNIALPTKTLPQLISLFDSKGFSVQEMVALVGAHTIGLSHCKEFSDRLFKFNSPSKSDPALKPKYAEGLKNLCSNYTKDPTMSAYNDVITPEKFDNQYYRNLQKGLGLLSSDQAIAADPKTKPFVDQYAANQNKFFEDFAKAMEKLSAYKPKTGNAGEVRRRCDTFNTINP